MSEILLSLLSTVVAVVLLAAVAELASRARLRRPGIVHLLWLAVLVRSLVPSLPIVPYGGELARGAPALLAIPADVPTSAATGSAGGSLGWLAIAGTVWIVGSAVLALRAARRLLAIRRLVDLARPAGAELRGNVERLARSVGVSPPRVVEIDEARSPFLFGLFRPVLVWPTGACPREARDAVLLHELAHLERRDPWTAWIELVAGCVWWWNPVVRHAVHQSRRFKELACDAAVMERRPASRLGYAHALLATVAGERRGPAEALGWIGPASRVKERLTSLYEAGARARTAPAAAIAVGLVVLGSLAGPTPAAPRTEARATPEATADGGATEGTERATGDGTTLAPERVDALRAQLEGFGVESFEELRQRAEARLAANPDDGRAWYELAFGYIGDGWYREAVRGFERQYELGYTTTYAAYNLACCHALLGEVDPAIFWLERAIESGYDQPLAIEEDEDLASLRSDPRYRELIDELIAQS